MQASSLAAVYLASLVSGWSVLVYECLQMQASSLAAVYLASLVSGWSVRV